MDGMTKPSRDAGNRILLGAVGDGWVSRGQLMLVISAVYMDRVPGDCSRTAWNRRTTDDHANQRDAIIVGGNKKAGSVVGAMVVNGEWLRRGSKGEDNIAYKHRDWVGLDAELVSTNVDPLQVVAELTVLQEAPAMSRNEAQSVTDSILRHEGNALDELRSAWIGRAWVALGYDSWDEYLSGVGIRVRLSKADRQSAVVQLREEGLSTRAIGSAIGVSDHTVRQDIKTGARNHAPEPSQVKGLDGKTYTPKPTDVAKPTKRARKRKTKPDRDAWNRFSRSNDLVEQRSLLKRLRPELYEDLIQSPIATVNPPKLRAINGGQA